MRLLSLYINRELNDLDAHIKSLGRLVQKKGEKCCVCESENVSIWLIDGAFLDDGHLILHARLLCEAHEDEWKRGKLLPYERLNGVLLIELPYQKPVGLWVNISWSDFVELLESHSNSVGDEVKVRLKDVSSMDEYLTKNSQFVFKGQIEAFLKNNNLP